VVACIVGTPLDPDDGAKLAEEVLEGVQGTNGGGSTDELGSNR
jgi:hypothetical protein